MKSLYKISRSILPCILLTLSIGFCYAFSLFVKPISEAIGSAEISVKFAFCLNIFFLGMGAAFFGRLIEKHIKFSAFLSSLLLFAGLVVTDIGVNCKSLVAIYAGSGVLCGLAEGIGYVTPVLNNILWWGKGKRKGLVAAISIVSFGLGSTLCSLLFKIYYPLFGICGVFKAFALTYLIMSIVSVVLINKPRFALNRLKREMGQKFDYGRFFADGYAIKSWIYMFLNISMGLIFIGSCASMLKEVNMSQNLIIITMMLCGIFNGCGRLLFPFLSDYMKRRESMLFMVLLLEIFLMIPPMFAYSVIPLSIIMINATYGSFFALLPSVLSDHYGNKNLSTRHGLILSSWGFASLFAYVCTFMINKYCDGYYFICYVLAIVYTINLVVVMGLGKYGKETYIRKNKKGEGK